MSKTIARFISGMLIGAMLITTSGCFGSFNLTRKIYKFNQGLGDKWLNEIAFLAMSIIPVYGVGVTVDVLILNSIEFWTGENPVSASDDVRSIELREQGVTLTLNKANQSVKVAYNSDGQKQEFVFERSSGETVVKSARGEVLISCLATDDGGIVLKDASGKVITMYSSADLDKIAQRLAVN